MQDLFYVLAYGGGEHHPLIPPPGFSKQFGHGEAEVASYAVMDIL
jgi:hypothetical protein